MPVGEESMNLIMKKTLKIMLLAILSIAFVSLVACGDNGGQNNNGGGENPKPEVSYTITYDLSEYPSATITSTTMTVKADKEYTLYTPALSGYTFVKWNYNGEEFAISGTYTIGKDITLTPVFEVVPQDPPSGGGEEGGNEPQPEVSYTITYDLSAYPSAIITATTMTVKEGEEYTLYTPALSGYTFVKWNYNGEEFAISGTYTLTESITLTPVFELVPQDPPSGGGNEGGNEPQPDVSYTITFNLSAYPNAKITAKTMTVIGGKAYTLYIPTLTGYTFVNWNYNGVKFETSGTYSIKGDITLTPVFDFDDNWVKEPIIK